MEAIIAWIAKTAIGAFIERLFGTVKEIWNQWLVVNKAEQKGRAEAEAEAARKAAERIEEGNLVEQEAKRDHARANGHDSDDGLDTSFRRD